MVLNIAELLSKAQAQGMSDKEIASLVGRNTCTIWRWKKNPPKSFIYDAGMQRLIDRVNDSPRTEPHAHPGGNPSIP